MAGKPTPVAITWALFVSIFIAVVIAVAVAPKQHHHAAPKPPPPAAPAPLRNGIPRPAQTAPACHVSPTGGQMGVCAPKPSRFQRQVQPRTAGHPSFVDLSNNDPVYGVANFKKIRGRGFDGLIAKANQAGYVDPTYARMIHDARGAGLRVGGYGFRDPTRATATRDMTIFVQRLRATGTCRGKGVAPPTIDAEYGNITRSDLQLSVRIVRNACGRAQVYTGQWYANPHWGCGWPSRVPGWISGYGVSNIRNYLPCGLRDLKAHQWTDRGFNGVINSDLSYFLGTQAQWDAYTGVRTSPPTTKHQRVLCKEYAHYRREVHHKPHSTFPEKRRPRAIKVRNALAAVHVSCKLDGTAVRR